MFKNVASQKLIVFAFDATTNLPKSGDAANITAYVGKDFGAATVLGDTSATEIDSTNAKGYYLFDLTQAETNADTLHFTAKSSTSNIVVIGAPATVYTLPANFTATSIDSNGRVDVIKIAGTTQTARDVGASVLLSSGTGAGQLDFTSGVVKANAVQWLGGTIPAVNVTGVPLVDAKYLLGTIFATPATAGIMDVNAKNVNNVSAASVTTINANLGTTQPVNYTGTGASALVKSDMVDIAGAAVGTSTAQIGVNVVNFGGAAGTFASGRPEVNTTHWSGTILATADTAGYPKVTVKSGTGTGEISISSGVVNADMVKVSTDATAADNLETMLDGTGGQNLTLARVVIDNSAGVGSGVIINAGTGGAGVEMYGVGGFAGLFCKGGPSGSGISASGNTTGAGITVNGGNTSGNGINVITQGGDGIAVTPTAGSALVLTGNGTSKHGAVITGGTAGTSDGVKAVAGSGGVPIRGDLTGNVTGNLSGSVGSVTGAVGSVTGAVGSVTGNLGGNVVGSVGSVTGAVGSVGTGGITAATFAAGAIDASAIATDALASAELGASAVTEIASGVWTYVIENSKTAEQYMRIVKAAVAGKLSGAATTTITIRDDADTKARVTATVDASGNRSAVTLDGT